MTPIMTAQGTGKKQKIIGICLIIYGIMAGIMPGEYYEGRRDDSTTMLLLVIIIAAIGFGIYMMRKGNNLAKSNVEVYDDCVRGNALINNNIGYFELKYQDISNAIAGKNNLMLNSEGIIYKIGISTLEASEIARYINGRK